MSYMVNAETPLAAGNRRRSPTANTTHRQHQHRQRPTPTGDTHRRVTVDRRMALRDTLHGVSQQLSLLAGEFGLKLPAASGNRRLTTVSSSGHRSSLLQHTLADAQGKVSQTNFAALYQLLTK